MTIVVSYQIELMNELTNSTIHCLLHESDENYRSICVDETGARLFDIYDDIPHSSLSWCEDIFGGEDYEVSKKVFEYQKSISFNSIVVNSSKRPSNPSWPHQFRARTLSQTKQPPCATRPKLSGNSLTTNCKADRPSPFSVTTTI